MPRDGEPVHRRLQKAALELFGERGYDQTTAAEIAARAGVTERTFFRHFADKREILFDGEASLRTALTDAIAAAPADLEPLRAMLLAFHAVETLLEENRPFSEPRQHVIAATPALRERELAKIAALTAALASALGHRGIEARLATLAAQAGMAAFSSAVTSWFADPTRALHAHIVEAFDDLYSLSSAAFSPPSTRDKKRGTRVIGTKRRDGVEKRDSARDVVAAGRPRFRVSSRSDEPPRWSEVSS